jgi:WD40 repeat protein
MRSKGDVVVEHAFDLFVVHAAADADFVRGYLLPALNLPASRVLLLDDLPLGATVVAELDRGVSRSRFTVAVLSPAYLADRWAVFGEQLATHLSAEAVRVIPLRLTDCPLPLSLDARVSLDFTDPARWEPEVARLRELLHTAAPAAEQIACPYPGMRPFGGADASRFFGRDKEIDDLVGRLELGEREIYVIGPSGSGKSSLVQAGLVHALEAGTSRLARSFVVRTMRPGERPCERLANAIEGDLATPEVTFEDFVTRHPPAERVLVFIDQLEELFTLTNAAERQRFIATLRTLRAERRCYLLMALRADFFGALMDSELWPDLAGRLSRLEVGPLRGAALAQAITAPAMRVGVHLETRLCDRLVADAATEPGALPHVQETLRLLWDSRRQRLLGVAEYEALGNGGRGLDIALARRADATMRTLTVVQQTIARRVLLRLVVFGEGRADTRRQQEVRALRSAADGEAEFSRVLQRLVDDRLVTVDGVEGAGDALADLSHEALLTAWPLLREWITRRRADEQRRRRLEANVGEWIERGRGAARLLDPVELSEAVQWMQSEAAQELGYGAELWALVTASRREVEKVQRQRHWRRLRAIAVLFLALVLGLVAWNQRRDAQRGAEAQRLLERGRALLDEHPMQALPYLVAARAAGLESVEIRMWFAQASRSVPWVTLVGHGSSVGDAAFSADGTRVVTASSDKTARVWDATTGKPVTMPLEHQGFVTGAAFSPDGTRVVTASWDKTARVWDAVTGKAVTMPLEHQGFVNTAAFSPDGTRVVTASDDKTAQVWDAVTGKAVTVPLEHQGFVFAAEFSRDGTRVVTASSDKTARIWDATTGKSVTAPLEHQAEVHAAAFSPDGMRVITASLDQTARVWDATTGKPVTGPLEHRGSVTAAAFSSDGTRVITASLDQTARVWDATTGKPVTGPLEHRGSVTAAAFSRDGTRVVTASEDQTARVWDATTGNPVTAPLEHQGFVTAAAFSRDGTRVVTASSDKTARVWDAITEKPVMAPLEHQGSVTAAAFSRDGTRVWDATTGKSVTVPLEHQGFVTAAAFSRDGTRVVTASRDKTARVWDATTGKPVTVPLEHQGFVFAAAFSRDGTRVVTASSDKTARIWDATTGKLVTAPLEHRVPSLLRRSVPTARGWSRRAWIRRRGYGTQ